MRWKEVLRWLVLLMLALGVIPSTPAYAAVTQNITVIATPFGNWTVSAPTGFTVTYVSDYEISLNWTNAPTSIGTMVRCSYGRPLTGITDGFEVYNGVANNTTHWVSQVGTLGILYYGAWSQAGDGSWGAVGDTEEGNFMSQSFLFVGLLALAFGLTVAAFKWKDILLSYSAALVWLAQGFWWLLGGITNFGLGDPWVNILVFVPFLMFFVVLLRLMSTEIQYEAEGQGMRTRYTTLGPEPKRRRGPTSYEAYAVELRRRTRG